MYFTTPFADPRVSPKQSGCSKFSKPPVISRWSCLPWGESLYPYAKNSQTWSISNNGGTRRFGGFSRRVTSCLALQGCPCFSLSLSFAILSRSAILSPLRPRIPCITWGAHPQGIPPRITWSKIRFALRHIRAQCPQRGKDRGFFLYLLVILAFG